MQRPASRLTLVLSDKSAYEYEKSLRRRSNTITQLKCPSKAAGSTQITSPVSEIMVSLGDIVPLAATIGTLSNNVWWSPSKQYWMI